MSATAFQRMRREQAAKIVPVDEEEQHVKALTEYTNKELKAMLDERDIEYDARANKETLVKLLEGDE
jgi:hypothetical protein